VRAATLGVGELGDEGGFVGGGHGEPFWESAGTVAIPACRATWLNGRRC
jgi:hypothetical protein